MRPFPTLPLSLVPTLVLLLAAAPLAAQDGAPAWADELRAIRVPTGRFLDYASRPLAPIDWPPPPLTTAPSPVRALYVNAWAFGSKRLYDIVRLIEGSEVNSLVIDVKDDTGYLTYQTEVPIARLIGANTQLRAPDTRQRLRTLIAHGIHPIARIVVAKDPLLASRKPGWAIQSSTGGEWHDRQGRAWVDAYNDSVWTYAAALGTEAVKMGFAEVQFDYVRFPDEPRSRMATAVFKSRRGNESAQDGVTRNIRMIREQFRKLGVPFTIDIFGLTTSAETDMGIGQKWENLVTSADAVLPMVYPSHYGRGSYGIDHPNAEPYAIIRHAMQDALRRSAPFKNSAEIRPYFQAFSLGPPRYTPAHVREQIRAAEELGIKSWVLWNARSAYERAYLRDASGKPETTASLGMAAAQTGAQDSSRQPAVPDHWARPVKVPATDSAPKAADTLTKIDSVVAIDTIAKPDNPVQPDSALKADSVVHPDTTMQTDTTSHTPSR